MSLRPELRGSLECGCELGQDGRRLGGDRLNVRVGTGIAGRWVVVCIPCYLDAPGTLEALDARGQS